MYYLKVIFLSLIGFFTPIALAVYTGPRIFGRALARPQPQLLAPSQDIKDQADNERLSFLRLDHQPSNARVESDSALDPASGENFLISFLVRIERFPPPKERVNLVAKYRGDMSPYPGWAISFFRRKNSLRPELYWRCQDGKGGWLSFDRLAVEPSRFYAVTLLGRPEKFVGVYLQDVDQHLSINQNSAQRQQNLQVRKEEGTEALETADVMYLGSYDTSEICIPQTDAGLLIGSPKTNNFVLEGNLGLLLIASPHRIPETPDDMKKFLSGGSLALVKKLKSDEINLWVSGRGKDESRFRRPIELTGAASWEDVRKNQPTTLDKSDFVLEARPVNK